MGALGAVCGFSGMRQPEANGFNVVGRGMESGTLTWVKNNFQNLANQYFPDLETAPYPFHTDIRIITEAPRPPGPLTTAKVRILVGWGVEKKLTGLMGLGGKIKAAPFLDREIDFLYNLVDHMMVAIRSIAATSVIRTLENELDLARQSAAEGTLRNEAVKKELEETLFRLSGFNHIFHELSGLKQSDRVLDSFLLVMLGIFSAQNGTIVYWDDATKKSHAAVRGFEDKTAPNTQPAAVREMLEVFFGSGQGANLGVMQATIVPSEQLNSLHLFPSKISIAISFKYDAVQSNRHSTADCGLRPEHQPPLRRRACIQAHGKRASKRLCSRRRDKRMAGQRVCILTMKVPTKIKAMLTHPYLALVLRLYIAGLFIYAGMVKINYTAEFAETIASYRMVPHWGVILFKRHE